MILFFSIVLFLSGLLAAEAQVSAALPKAKPFIEKLAPYQEMLGGAGIVLGVHYLIASVDTIGRLHSAPLHYLLMLAAVVVLLALGLLFGLEIIRRNLKDTSLPFFQRLEGGRAWALRFQKVLGIAALALGVITFVGHL